MEQYLNLVWKNYTASLSRNSDEENFSSEQDDDSLAGTELHYKIPFWIGVIVISLLFLSAIIATIRYCFHSLCLSRTETEKVALVPPRSPCLTSAANTIQRQRRDIPLTHSHHPSDFPEKLPPPSSSSLAYHEELKDHRSNISIVPIVRQHSRPHFTPTHTLTRQHQKDVDTDDIDNHHFRSSQSSHSRAPVDFRKKVHGIYVLPVSPALSSSSSTTTNTDEMIKNASNTMPIRSLRHISSSVNVHNDSLCRGIKNDSYSDSPQPKDRTLPRSHAGTLRRIQPPSQPPPLPPAIPQLHFNDVQTSINSNQEKLILQHQSATLDLDPDTIALRFNSQKIYGAMEDNEIKKAPPPPVPSRSQKPTVLPIGFEGLTSTPAHSNVIGFRIMSDPSPQEDYSEHTWPKPPESMTTSEISMPPQPLPPSIPYDRLNHDHLIPTVLMRQNSTTSFFQHRRFGEHSMLTESET